MFFNCEGGITTNFELGVATRRSQPQGVSKRGKCESARQTKKTSPFNDGQLGSNTSHEGKLRKDRIQIFTRVVDHLYDQGVDLGSFRAVSRTLHPPPPPHPRLVIVLLRLNCGDSRGRVG